MNAERTNYTTQVDSPGHYPQRIEVNRIDQDWDRNLSPDDYAPAYYVAQVVLNNDRLENGGWADPEDHRLIDFNKVSEFGPFRYSTTGPIRFDSKGRPLNPMGRRGIEGRGELGKWGANHAADAIVSRKNKLTGNYEVVCIDGSACPGGMVEDGHTHIQTVLKEVVEEALNEEKDQSHIINAERARVVSRGYVKDKRETDHAWVESVAYHWHLNENEGESLELAPSKRIENGGDGEVENVAWMEVTEELLLSMNPDHARMIMNALADFDDAPRIDLPPREETAFYVGRFQPFHKGHESIVNHALSYNDRLILAIGSPYQSHTPKNPFTACERMNMIQAALEDMNIPKDRVEIHIIPDIGRAGLWVQHVEAITPEFQRVYTGSSYVARLFSEYSRAEVEELPKVEHDQDIVSATRIRESLAKGSSEWKEMVSPSVARCIQGFNAVTRLQEMMDS